ncbi:hypothetical protein MSPP1_001317 [Malassezia sp. CBS 17886]|nr:hypothetical protein MSPP1_001317 [Malassezia sp. CBS 17886]
MPPPFDAACAMQEEPLFPAASASTPRTRGSFSCSPRDFRLPLAMDSESDTPSGSPVDSTRRRSHARRASLLLHDKNKLRVSELLQEERSPTDFEVASEARLQRHLGGCAADAVRRPHIGARLRRMQGASMVGNGSAGGSAGADAQPAGFFHPTRSALYMDTMRDVLEDEMDDSFLAAPLPSGADNLAAAYSSEDSDEPYDEDAHSYPPPHAALGPFFPDAPRAAPMPVPIAAARDADGDASASPARGKRKCDVDYTRSPGQQPGAKRKAGNILFTRKGISARVGAAASVSPHSTSPRRMSLFWGSGGAGLVSPSSSPLAVGEARSGGRRAAGSASGGASAALTFTPIGPVSASPTGSPMAFSRPPSPVVGNSWIPSHSRSPSHAGSGPGYGSAAIGLRLGARGPWDSASLGSWLGDQADGREMDEGVRALELD